MLLICGRHDDGIIDIDIWNASHSLKVQQIRKVRRVSLLNSLECHVVQWIFDDKRGQSLVWIIFFCHKDVETVLVLMVLDGCLLQSFINAGTAAVIFLFVFVTFFILFIFIRQI